MEKFGIESDEMKSTTLGVGAHFPQAFVLLLVVNDWDEFCFEVYARFA